MHGFSGPTKPDPRQSWYACRSVHHASRYVTAPSPPAHPAPACQKPAASHGAAAGARKTRLCVCNAPAILWRLCLHLHRCNPAPGPSPPPPKKNAMQGSPSIGRRPRPAISAGAAAHPWPCISLLPHPPPTAPPTPRPGWGLAGFRACHAAACCRPRLLSYTCALRATRERCPLLLRRGSARVLDDDQHEVLLCRNHDFVKVGSDAQELQVVLRIQVSHEVACEV